MNELDQFVKHTFKVKHYARYTDDFLIISRDRKYLKHLLPCIEGFLRERLRLELHPKKVSICRFHQGVDFLGYVIFPHHILVRATTRRRMIRKLDERILAYKADVIREENLMGTLRSYLGVLLHASSHRLRIKILNGFWFRLTR